MKLELSVRFDVTPDEQQVRLVVTGRLTESNQQLLYPSIHRAYTLATATEVVIDLSAVEHLETAALDLLRWEVEHYQPIHLTQPVRFALPDPPPDSGLPSAPESTT